MDRINTSLPVYIVYSDRSLPDIQFFLENYGTVKYIEVVLDKSGKETNRTLVVLDSELIFHQLEKDGYTRDTENSRVNGIRISKFYITNGSYPRKSLTQSKDIFVKYPQNIDFNHCSFFLQNFLNKLSDVGFYSQKSFNILQLKYLKTRKIQPDEKNPDSFLYKGFILQFDENVDITTIAVVKTLLCYMNWVDNEPVVCAWKKTHRKKSHTLSDMYGPYDKCGNV